MALITSRPPKTNVYACPNPDCTDGTPDPDCTLCDGIGMVERSADKMAHKDVVRTGDNFAPVVSNAPMTRVVMHFEADDVSVKKLFQLARAGKHEKPARANKSTEKPHAKTRPRKAKKAP